MKNSVKLTTIIFCMMSSTSAFAQAAIQSADAVEEVNPTGADAAASEGVGEIIVTAQRREQSLRRVPISAVVTSGEVLTKLNLMSLDSVAVRSPAVRLAQSPAADFISIRGVGSSNNQGFEQSVATFVDGIYRGRSRAARSALFDAERVEILRGPQTTFFGNNAIAGAFNITSRKPGDDLAANALASYVPATDEVNLEAGVSVPLSDTLAVRVAGRLTRGGGYIKNDTLGTVGPDLNQRLGHVAIRWRPSDRVETNINFIVNRQRDKDVFSSQLLDCPADPIFGAPRGLCARFLAASGGTVEDKLDFHAGSGASAFDMDLYQLSQNTSIDIGGADIVLTTGYFHHNYKNLNDPLPFPADKGGSLTTSKRVSASQLFERFSQFSQEIRLQSDQGGAFEYMVGGYYASSRLNVNLFQQSNFLSTALSAPAFYAPGTPITFHAVNREAAETKSAFASLTLRPANSVRINAGLRYTNVTKRDHRMNEMGLSSDLPSVGFVKGPQGAQLLLVGPVFGGSLSDYSPDRRSDSKLMPAISVQYDVAPRSMVYASYSNGFKAGGFAFAAPSGLFDPETVNAYEVGLKTSLFDNRAALNIAVFRNQYSNLQQSINTVTAQGLSRVIVGNVTSSRSQGVEAGLTLKVTDTLTLSSDLSYLDAKYTSYPGAPCTVVQLLGGSPCSQNLSGKRPAFAPKYSGNVAVNYDTPISENIKFSAYTNVYFTSRYFTTQIADEYLVSGSAAKIDARIGISTADDRWEFAIVGKNLTNKATSSYVQNVNTSPGSFFSSVDPGRSVGFQIVWKK